MKSIGREASIMVSINGLYTLANAMSAVFMNVYLYTYTGSLVVMAIYTAIRIAAFPIVFTIGGKIACKRSLSITLTMGLGFMILMLMFVLMCNDQFGTMPYLVYVVALINGIGESFFWVSVNSLNQFVTSTEKRALYIGLIGIFNNVANVVAPLISSYIIDMSLTDNEGYVSIFKIVLVLYAVLAVMSFLVKVKDSMKPFQVLKLVRLKDAKWRYCLLSTIFYGMRDSLVLMLAGLLVYNATGGQGGLYGRFLALFAVISIIAYIFCARRMKAHNSLRFYQFGAVLIASSTIVLVMVPNMYGAIYYGVVNALATPFYANAYQIMSMNTIASYSKTENMIGRVIAKEVYLSIGRVTGMLAIVACFYILPESMYLMVSVSAISLFPIILIAYATNYYRKNPDEHI